MDFGRSANLPEFVNAVCAPAARTHVDLVLVDEIHNISLATRSGAKVSDQLKYFAERLPAPFAFAGIEVEAQGLIAGVRGRQIAGRLSLITLKVLLRPQRVTASPIVRPCDASGFVSDTSIPPTHPLSVHAQCRWGARVDEQLFRRR